VEGEGLRRASVDERVMYGSLDELPGCELHGDLQLHMRGSLKGRVEWLHSLSENDERTSAAAVEHLGTAAAATWGGVEEA
jgi:hypothetical protein